MAEAVLALRGPFTVDTAAMRWREYSAQAEAADALDVSAVDAIDSAGVALILALRDRGADGDSRPRLLGVPPRMRQLCIAHRIDLDGN